MQSLFEQLATRCAAGERLALCTVIDARGSTPQQRGARMIVGVGGSTLGTLGGGCVEAEVRQKALQRLLASDASPAEPMSFRLNHDHGWDDGMWCGGVLDVYVQIVGAADAEKFAAISGALAAGEAVRIEIAEIGFVETIESAPRLIVAGAGHVSQALCRLIGPLGFRTTVIDDRADFLTADRFPAAGRIVGAVDVEIAKLPIDANTYVVLVTRGHHRDAAALAAVIGRPARYVGMIGSKRKVRTILGELAGQGVPREKLAEVRSPIGLELNAVTVDEIAISIAAELVAVRRGAGALTGKAMKISRDELDAWVDRKTLAE